LLTAGQTQKKTIETEENALQASRPVPHGRLETRQQLIAQGTIHSKYTVEKVQGK
jgi:hypothetical protein